MAAPAEAQYALYAAGRVVPEFTLVLRKGESIGFDTTPDCGLVGVAGTYAQSLAPARYRWIVLDTRVSRAVSDDAGRAALTGAAAAGVVAALTGASDSNQLHDQELASRHHAVLFNDGD